MNLDTFDWPAGLRFLVALGLGLLVGIERESSHPEDKRPVVGGVRTFPLPCNSGFQGGRLLC